MNRRGVTLLELLVVVAMMAVLMGAVTRAYVSSLDFNDKLRTGRDTSDKHRIFEDRVRDLLLHVYLSGDASDVNSYFIAGDPSAAAGSGAADQITFTTTGDSFPESLASSTTDFETLNSDQGPMGGVAEISLSTNPIGDAGNNQGLFVRKQRPADGDPTQGGKESVLNSDIATVEFQFFDGLSWVSVWDTRTGERRLPAAVKVIYTLNDDNTDHTFIVALPFSDVTPTNPLTTEGTQ
ncbi:hypothetical protein BH11ARM1_BH11ARM1_06840 [soil metagenome]